MRKEHVGDSWVPGVTLSGFTNAHSAYDHASSVQVSVVHRGDSYRGDDREPDDMGGPTAG